MYWRRFDTNTDRWLIEPGQLGEDLIRLNRGRFYPELEWTYLDEDEKALKDAAVEMFLKSLELIGTFHPELNGINIFHRVLFDKECKVYYKNINEHYVA